MANPHGTPIWYELASADPDASKAFYEDVLGWTVHPAQVEGMDYRMIDAGEGDFVGGLARYQDGVAPVPMPPGWRVYIGVDDVDATAARIRESGGRVLIPPFDLPNVGRMAYIADPQGIACWVMRGASDADSTVFSPTQLGKCTWNELATPDQAAANAFYADVFGWTYPDTMPMGELGDYVFVQAGDRTIGATMPARTPGPPPNWTFYFRAPDIAAAAAKVAAGGGTVHHGPQEVPGGDRIIIASDPAGTMFGVVGPGH